MKAGPHWVIGFDLSLRAPAAIALRHDWKPGDWKSPSIKAWLAKPSQPKGDDLRGQMLRYDEIAAWAVGVVKAVAATAPVLNLHVFVEAYGFSKNNAQASKIMESGGITKHAIFAKYGCLVQPVAANTARKLFLGTVPKKDPKLAVQDVLFNKCRAPKSWDENQADAFVVANYGLFEIGGRSLLVAPDPDTVEHAKGKSNAARSKQTGVSHPRRNFGRARSQDHRVSRGRARRA